MFGINNNEMTFQQIQMMMAQNPMLKAMIYNCIQNPMIMNPMMNILNVLNYNPVILEQMELTMNQEMMMNNLQMNKINNEPKKININFRRMNNL